MKIALISLIVAIAIGLMVAAIVTVSTNKQEFNTTGLTVVTLYDKDCKLCYNYTIHKDIVKYIYNGSVNFENVDVNSNEGKQLIEKYNITKIPTVVIFNLNESTNLSSLYKPFGKEVDNAYILTDLDNFFLYTFGAQLVPYKRISLTSNEINCEAYNFTNLPVRLTIAIIQRELPNVKVSEKEGEPKIICDGQISSDIIEGIKQLIPKFSQGEIENCNRVIASPVLSFSNGKSYINFEKETYPLFNKSNTPKLKAFVMSFCPYGLQMLRILNNVVKNIPELKSNIEVYYIVSKGLESNCYNGFCSMHGREEVKEDLYQVCIREKYPEKYWNYINCYINASNINSYEEALKHGQECINKTFTQEEIEEISNCFNNEATQLINKDVEEVSNYGITGSPTLVLNEERLNEFLFGGRSSEAIKKAICCSFTKKPEFCNTNLSTAQANTWFSTTYSSGIGGEGTC